MEKFSPSVEQLLATDVFLYYLLKRRSCLIISYAPYIKVELNSYTMYVDIHDGRLLELFLSEGA